MIEKVPSGIKGLDELLGGGFPKGRVTLVCGGPGSGKTILCANFLVSGALQYNEPGVFVTLDESRDHLIKEMAVFGWDLKRLEDEKKLLIVDASPIRILPSQLLLGPVPMSRKEVALTALIDLIRRNVRSVGAKRIVVDPISMLLLQYPEPAERRYAIASMFEELSKFDAAVLVSSELRVESLEREYQIEEYISHGVILLQSYQNGKVKAIKVEKMRGSHCDPFPRPYSITNEGFVVFPKEMVI
ncbi:MAG: AAA family ATPase [Candidatus Methanomethyliales bacterium]|nr:AAA family ATPase [Candidatus Methanomethylicales archaeon]